MRKIKLVIPGITLRNKWSEREMALLKETYLRAGNTKSLNLDGLAALLGRHKSNICRKAREIGLPTTYRRKLTDEQIESMRKRNKDHWNSLSKLEQQSMSIKGGAYWNHLVKLKQDRIKKRLRFYTTNGRHPRGMLGKTHTKSVRLAMSKRVRKMWNDPTSTFYSTQTKQRKSKAASKAMKKRIRQGGYNIYSLSKKGKRKDLNNQFFRSRWEANYARYLNLLKIHWEYEPRTFEFPVKRGTRFYTPDFLLKKTGEWVEIKGWFRPVDKTKFRRFKKYYPNEFATLIIVIHNPDSESPKNIELMIFLLDEMGIAEDRIEGYKEICDKVGPLIDYWE